MKTYRVLLPVLVLGEHGQGEVFDHEFNSPADETASVASGLLEIVPRTYKVTGSSTVFDTKPGSTFTAALTLAQEQHLIGGGFIELAGEAPTRKAARSAKTSGSDAAKKE